MTDDQTTPNIKDQIDQARQLGYGEDEILGFLSNRPDLAPKIAQAQSSGYGTGEILDYLGKGTQTKPPTDTPWDIAPGAWEGTKALGSDLYNMAKFSLSDDTPEQGKAMLTQIGSALNASDDQLAQAHDAWQRGDHVEALGHLGRSIPFFGEVPGKIGDIAGGQVPTYDKNGNQLTPYIPPRPYYATGQALPLIASAFAPDIVAGGVNAGNAVRRGLGNLTRIDPMSCHLRVLERRIEGVPLFDSTFTANRNRPKH